MKKEQSDENIKKNWAYLTILFIANYQLRLEMIQLSAYANNISRKSPAPAENNFIVQILCHGRFLKTLNLSLIKYRRLLCLKTAMYTSLDLY